MLYNEVMPLLNHLLNTLDSCVSQAVAKIFNTYDKDNINHIRLVCNLSYVSAMVERRINVEKEQKLTWSQTPERNDALGSHVTTGSIDDAESNERQLRKHHLSTQTSLHFRACFAV